MPGRDIVQDSLEWREDLTDIHPTAIVDSGAEIASGVVVGPFAVVEKGAKIGAGCVIEAHAIVRHSTTIGERNVIGHGSVIGGDPQDRKYSGEPTFLQIGNDNVFREFVTVHRATGEGKSTVVGNNNYLMAFCHLGHNTVLYDNITMANSVGVSGHVTIENGVNIGGMTGIHQFVRIGQFSMVGGMSRVTKDVPPFMLTEGTPLRVYDINSIGLRRMGVTPNVRLALHKACKLLFRSEMGMARAIQAVRREVEVTPEVEYLLNFLENAGGGRFGRQDQR